MTATFQTAAPTPPTPLSFSSSPDLIAWLPEAAAERLRALRQHFADLRSVVPPFEDRQAAANAKVAAENALKRLQAHPSAGGFGLPKGNDRVIAAEATLERCTAGFERLTTLYDTRLAVWTATSHVLSTWLRDGGRRSGVVLQDFDGPEAKPLKGESIVDAIERHRRRGRELRADLHKISNSPFPSAYCKHRVREMITELAERGRPSLSALVEQGRDVIEWPTTMQQVTLHNAGAGASGFVQQTDVALFAWMHKPALIAALDREIDNESDDKSALTLEVRQKREAEVLGDLLDTERQEATLMFRGWSEGLPITPRADHVPVAVLGVVLVASVPAVSSGTSPGYSFHLRR